MFISFRCDNHRSLCFEQSIDFRAQPAEAGNDRLGRALPGHSEHLLPALGIFGANASGKSNLLDALAFMRQAVSGSHRLWPPDGGVPRDPFAWGGHADRASLFEVTFIAGGVRYVYGFKVDDEQVCEEWIFAWPSGRKQKWLERKGASFDFGAGLKGENRRIAQVTRENGLFLSTAAQHRHTQLGVVYRWFRSLRCQNLDAEHEDPRHHLPFERRLAHLLRSRDDLEDEQSLFPQSDASFLRLLELLRSADLGIEDIQLSAGGRKRGPRILLRHSSSDGDAWLPLEEESDGTRALLRLAARALETLHVGRVLIVDDLDSHLHPLLTRALVKLFNCSEANPENAQILFSSHASVLMAGSNPALRADQIWLASKDGVGATALTRLSVAGPGSVDLERGYLEGRFGAAPDCSPLNPDGA